MKEEKKEGKKEGRSVTQRWIGCQLVTLLFSVENVPEIYFAKIPIDMLSIDKFRENMSIYIAPLTLFFYRYA